MGQFTLLISYDNGITWNTFKTYSTRLEVAVAKQRYEFDIPNARFWVK